MIPLLTPKLSCKSWSLTLDCDRDKIQLVSTSTDIVVNMKTSKNNYIYFNILSSRHNRIAGPAGSESVIKT